MIIAIDIGHGEDTYPPSKGVVKPNGEVFEEHWFNSAVVVKATELLKDYDVEVILTQQPRATDLSLQTRVYTLNGLHKMKPINFLVSVHANAHYPGSNANGYESYYWYNDTQGKTFCNLWNKNMRSTGLRDRGVKVSSNYKNSWYIVKNTPCSAVLLEHFFYTNWEELEKCYTQEKIDEFAQILVDTLAITLKLEKKKKSDKLPVRVLWQEIELDYIVKDNKNYVPIRDIAEALGYKVDWDNIDKKVLIMKGE